jgi:hypothetical protein
MASVNMRTIDLSGVVSAANIELSPWQRQMLERLPTGRITINGYWVGHDDRANRHAAIAYHLWARWRAVRNARLARMHTAYHRRRR